MNVDPTKRPTHPDPPGVSEDHTPDAFEAALHQALHRREAVPADLTARLLAIADEPAPLQAPVRTPQVPRKRFWQLFQLPELPLWAAGAVAALLVLIVSLAGGTAMHVRQQQHARAAEATHNFELATSIEDKALEHTREQLREAGVFFEK